MEILEHRGKPDTTCTMKAKCMGEFSFTREATCLECAYEGNRDDKTGCDICYGSLVYLETVTVPWVTCKEIYQSMAALSAQEFTSSIDVQPLTKIDQIKVGDSLILNDDKATIVTTVQKIKVTEHDGTEVIFNEKENSFFNVGMYLEGKSWVKNVRVGTFNKD